MIDLIHITIASNGGSWNPYSRPSDLVRDLITSQLAQFALHIHQNLLAFPYRRQPIL